MAREGVPAAPHGHGQAVLLPEPNRSNDVRHARAANDQRGVLVERAVPDLAVDVVLRRARAYDIPPKGSLVDLDLVSDGSHRPSVSHQTAFSSSSFRPPEFVRIRTMV